MYAQVKQLPTLLFLLHAGILVGSVRMFAHCSQVREPIREQTEDSNSVALPQTRKGKSEKDTIRKQRDRKHSRDEINKGDTKRGGSTGDT